MRRTHVIIAAYALLAVLVVPVFPHFPSPNEFTRWLLDVAIVDYHTVEVTPVVRATGLWMEDLARVGDRYYSNKAPGGAFVALPAYAIARGGSMRTTLDAMRLAASTLPAILLALWLAAVARRFGCSEDRIAIATAALLFGSPLFAYGLLFFAHALSAFALFGAWARLFGNRDSGSGIRESYFAGALIGLAVLSEYPSAIPAAVLMACAWRRIPRIILGGLPFAIALGVYDFVAFGSVFSLSSAHEVDASYRAMARSGIFGVGLPSPEHLFGLLFDPSKGLFILSPVLLIAFAGLASAGRKLPRASLVALVATPLSILLTFAGYPNWSGGWTVGARYLVVAVPFLAMLIAFAATTWIESLLLGASIAVIAVVSLVFPFVSADYRLPWVSFAWPILRDGFVAPNLLHLVARPLAIAVPFAIVFGALVVAIPRRAIAVAIVGIVIWFGAGFIVQAKHPAPPYIRDFVEEVYFGKRGTIRDPGLEARARQTERLPPPKWPF